MSTLRLRFFQPTTMACKCETKLAEPVQEKELPVIFIGVGGMMCYHCTAAVEQACMKVPGTVSAVADLEKKQVTVTGTADYEALKQAIIDEEYEILEG